MAAAGNVALGGRAIGLLDEPHDGRDGARCSRCGELEIAEAGLGPRRCDADRRDRIVALGGTQREIEDVREPGLVGDVLVGGEHGEDCVGIAFGERRRGETDRSGGIAPDRLGEQFDPWDDEPRRRDLRLGGHDHRAASGDALTEPHGCGDHRFAVGAEREQLLGPLAPTCGPQPRAAAACENDCVSHARIVAGIVTIVTFRLAIGTVIALSTACTVHQRISAGPSYGGARRGLGGEAIAETAGGDEPVLAIAALAVNVDGTPGIGLLAGAELYGMPSPWGGRFTVLAGPALNGDGLRFELRASFAIVKIFGEHDERYESISNTIGIELFAAKIGTFDDDGFAGIGITYGKLTVPRWHPIMDN